MPSDTPPRARSLSALLASASALALAACGGGGGGGAPARNAGPTLGMHAGDYADYAADKNRGNFANRFARGQLPASVDLRGRGWVPPPGDQGKQGSCVGWASAYGLKTVQEGAEEKWAVTDASHQFSPSFVFNQIKAPGGQGSQPKDAVDLLVKKGCATLATMPYDENDFDTMPTNAALEEAAKYRAKSAQQVPLNQANMKSVLAAGTPIVVGVWLYAPFMDELAASGHVYGPEHVRGQFQGGHAMCVVGYDDAKGAFLTLNSWSPSWGENGYCWLDYRLLDTPCPDVQGFNVLGLAYTVEDMPNAGKQLADHPTDLRASGDNPNFVHLSWTAAASVSGYVVQRSLDARNWVDVLTNVKETYANDAPADYATYTYRVLGLQGVDKQTNQPILTQASNTAQGRRAKDGGGNGPAPSNVRATTDLPLSIRVRWDAMPAAQRYLVVRSENDNTGPYDIVDYLSGTETEDLPPVQGKLFYYRVAAITANGPTAFSTAAEGKTASSAPVDLSGDDMLYPFDRNFDPLPMMPNQDYTWPYWLVTNWSLQPIRSDRHVVLVGLFRPAAQGFESRIVAGWYMDPQFPGDTSVLGQNLPLRYTGKDLLTQQPIEKGNYYWFVGVYLLDEHGAIVADANMSDNEFYLLDRVRVHDS